MGDVFFLSGFLRASCFTLAASVTAGSTAWAAATDPPAQPQVTVPAQTASVDPAASEPLPLNVQPIPEPGTLILLGLGAALTSYRPRRHGRRNRHRRDPGH